MTFSPTRPLHRFQSTPSARRATVVVGNCHVHVEQFQSTPSARRATGNAVAKFNDFYISIHALREEGDLFAFVPFHILAISIHALREEGDSIHRHPPDRPRNFNPRPPRGGRQPAG